MPKCASGVLTQNHAETGQSSLRAETGSMQPGLPLSLDCFLKRHVGTTQVTYEAYGAGGTGFIMECLTDNVNRCA